jgi:hypothetical protein
MSFQQSIRADLGHVARRLRLEHFHGLKEELSQWRTDFQIQEMEGEKPGGIILGFVRGLRLSARLIYAIRDALSSSGLEVDWGHLLTEEGNACSLECDIIIHLPGFERIWNGYKNSIMDFKFINFEKAIAVVSCKSFLRSIDREYCKKMRPYVNNILLFAECCEPTAVERLKRSAKSAGYKGFWYLYACNQKTLECVIDEKVWINFIETLKSLAERYSTRNR